MRYRPDDVLRIDQSTFDEIDDWIKAAEASGRSIQYGLNTLAMTMAYANMGIAQEMSRGPLDPRGVGVMEIGHRFVGDSKGNVRRQPITTQTAWKIPVRRITSRYYKGWKVKRLVPGTWMLYNDSREAYFIEFGIHPTGSLRATEKGHVFVMRVRRPVAKLSLRKTLALVDTSNVAGRVWEASFAPFRENYVYRGHPGDLISLDQIQSMTGMRFI